MTLKLSPSNICRTGGCTLTGALSVTTQVRDSVTVVHGPNGCSHHNFSLLHATSLDNERLPYPNLVSSGLGETEIIFGGEKALDHAIDAAFGYDPRIIFVLSTCIVETIGDDVVACCSREQGIPVIPIPTAGFLGGTFQDGVNNALIAIAGTAEARDGSGAMRGKRITAGVNIIGEMNLEYEIEENFMEVNRLLSLLGIPVITRFVHDMAPEQISRIGDAELNILRDPGLVPVGEFLRGRFGTPFLVGYPLGLSGSIAFLKNVGGASGVPYRTAVAQERAMQEATIETFSDLRGSKISWGNASSNNLSISIVKDLARALDLKTRKGGCIVPVPHSPPIGTTGVRRMLHRWRRAIHA